ncbi:MAG: hypothetical protein CL923_05120 [Deltaproteobacteria bacterium]|nr:hypothetical protein [Deltaproteobacteria bacterium]
MLQGSDCFESSPFLPVIFQKRHWIWRGRAKSFLILILMSIMFFLDENQLSGHFFQSRNDQSINVSRAPMIGD